MNIQDLENLIELENEGNIDDNDFGIIITPEGKLKMLLLPDDVDGPEAVPDILAKIIGLFDQDSVDRSHRVIH